MSQHLESRASKLSGVFGTHSSLFHLNHLTFKSSVKLLLPGQYLLSAPLAALQFWPRLQPFRRRILYLLIKPGLQILHKAFIRHPAWGTPTGGRAPSTPTYSIGALLPATNGDAPCADQHRPSTTLLPAQESRHQGTNVTLQPQHQRKSDLTEGLETTKSSPISFPTCLLPRISTCH